MWLRRSWLIAWCVGLSACAPVYTGGSSTLPRDALRSEPGWTAVSDVPYVPQQSQQDCGAAALEMVMRYWRGDTSTQVNAGHGLPEDARVSAAQLREHARSRGYSAFVIEGTLNDLAHELEAGRPTIAGLAKPTTDGALGHYEVVIGLHRARQRIATLDPANGPREYAFEDFLHEWIGAGRPLLVIIGPAQPQVTADAAALR